MKTPKLPPLPDGFKFVAPCSYTSEELGMQICIDYVDPAQREYEKRFVVQYVPADYLMNDDWNVVLRQIEKAEDELRAWNAEKHIWKE
jgi:hypothetical protein